MIGEERGTRENRDGSNSRVIDFALDCRLVPGLVTGRICCCEVCACIEAQWCYLLGNLNQTSKFVEHQFIERAEMYSEGLPVSERAMWWKKTTMGWISGEAALGKMP